MMVVIPLSFSIFSKPVSLLPSVNLSIHATTTGSLLFGTSSGTVSVIGTGGTVVEIMVAPFARASARSFSTLGIEATQRGLFSLLQVCLTKSITKSAVVFGSTVTALSSGAGGAFTLDHSSIMV